MIPWTSQTKFWETLIKSWWDPINKDDRIIDRQPIMSHVSYESNYAERYMKEQAVASGLRTNRSKYNKYI